MKSSDKILPLVLVLTFMLIVFVLSQETGKLRNTIDIEAILYERKINKLQDENIELRYTLFEVTQDSFWINSIYEDAI